jgi:hypothetical protein
VRVRTMSRAIIATTTTTIIIIIIVIIIILCQDFGIQMLKELLLKRRGSESRAGMPGLSI